MRKRHAAALIAAFVLSLSATALADLKIKQKVTMGGQTIESTRSIKGQRERTEQKIDMGDPRAGSFMPEIATITQCDLKRTVKLNDAKRLYMVEPFASPAAAASPRAQRTEPQPRSGPTRTGGTVTMTHNIKDTGERKVIFGMQARHLIITQEVESSPDSCNGASRSKIEIDGWFVDLTADFNCPAANPTVPGIEGMQRPDCTDRVITKGNAATRTGFMIEGTMKFFGTDGSVQMTQTTETLELTRTPLSAALFDVPAGYSETASSQNLYAMSMPAGVGDGGNADVSPNRRGGRPAAAANQADRAAAAQPNAKSVAVSVSVGSVSEASQAEIEQYIRRRIAERGLRAVTGTGDYSITVQLSRAKQSTAGKIGGIFGKVTGVPTGGVSDVDVELTATLAGAKTGQAKVKRKFEGPVSAAIQAAVDQALDQLLAGLGN